MLKCKLTHPRPQWFVESNNDRLYLTARKQGKTYPIVPGSPQL